MKGIAVLLFAIITSIPLNLAVRFFGDEKAKWEIGKSIICMFVCFSIEFAFIFYYAVPNKIQFGLVASLLGWFSVVFTIILCFYGLGFRKTFITTLLMVALTSPLKLVIY